MEPPDEKRRPILVLTRDGAVPAMDKLLAAPLTSTIRGIPTEVSLDKNDGVPRDCVVALDSTAPVLKAYLVDHLTTLSSERMLEVCRALAIATACP